MYLVTQNSLYSKNLQPTPTILWFYCKELYTRIPKHQDLLFYEFPTIFYGISNFTAKITKESLEHYSHESRPIQITPWVFLSFNPRSLARFGKGNRGGSAGSRRRVSPAARGRGLGS